MKAFAHRQRGSGLLEIALVVLLVAAAIAAGFVYLKAQVPPRQAQAQEQALDWADQAIVAFAASYGRLPCPASTPGGTEDCGATGKGWLPAQTLEDVKPRFDADGPGHAASPMRYVVYRGTDADLAVAANRYEPWQWDSDNSVPSNWGLGAVNGLDFCTALATASSRGYDAAQAHTADPQGAAVNIAYGVAAAGITGGTVGRFDDTNGDSSAAIESPARQADADYDDRVRVRDFATLGQSMSCTTTLAAVDSVGRATDVWADAVNQQGNNKQDAQISISNAAVALLLQGADVTEAAGDITSSTVTLATITGELSASIAACALPPWVQCALIPVFTAALGTDVAAVIASAGSIATNVVALALTGTAMGLAIDAAVQAGADVGSGMGGIDPTTVVDQQAIDQACTSALMLDAKATKAQSDLDGVTASSKAADSKYLTDLGGLTTDKDHPEQASNFSTALLAFAEAKYAVSTAVGATAEALTELTAWDAANGGSCNGSPLCGSLPPDTSFSSLQAKCLTEPNPDLRQVYCDASQRITTERTQKQANYDSAVQAEATARAAEVSARMTYRQAFTALPVTKHDCAVDGNVVTCGSLHVDPDNESNDPDGQFKAANYCTTTVSGTVTTSQCNTNGLQARQVFDDAMGYPTEVTTQGNPGDKDYVDPDAQLGPNGKVSLAHQIVADTQARDDAKSAAATAHKSCDDLKALQQGVQTSGGSAVGVWSGAEDIMRQVDNQGTVGPVKSSAGSTP